MPNEIQEILAQHMELKRVLARQAQQRALQDRTPAWGGQTDAAAGTTGVALVVSPGAAPIPEENKRTSWLYRRGVRCESPPLCPLGLPTLLHSFLHAAAGLCPRCLCQMPGSSECPRSSPALANALNTAPFPLDGHSAG